MSENASLCGAFLHGDRMASLRSTTERRTTRDVQAHIWFSDPNLQVARNEVTYNVETRALLITHPYFRNRILRC